jgi:hypothetical protein
MDTRPEMPDISELPGNLAQSALHPGFNMESSSRVLVTSQHAVMEAFRHVSTPPDASTVYAHYSEIEAALHSNGQCRESQCSPSLLQRTT